MWGLGAVRSNELMEGDIWHYNMKHKSNVVSRAVMEYLEPLNVSEVE